MSTTTPEKQNTGIAEAKQDVIDLGVADDLIKSLEERYVGLRAGTQTGYGQVREAIADVRSIRTGVEKSRKELKASALEWGRKVDAEAKRVTSLLLAIEEPLKAEKARIDDEKARLRQEKQEAAERERRAKEEAERKEREEKERAERERVKKEQAAERERLAAERKKLEAERQKMMAEKQAIEAERQRQQAEIAKAKREQAEAERKAEAARLAEERKPDREKLIKLAGDLRAFADTFPRVTTDWANDVLQSAKSDIDCAVDAIVEQCETQIAAEKVK